ncbi:hypothetical protein ACTFIY_003203 [Dictyostelium cf. discoideum]
MKYPILEHRFGPLDNIEIIFLKSIFEIKNSIQSLMNLGEKLPTKIMEPIKYLFYSKEKFESIKKSFSETELNSTLNNLDSREEIKQMYKIFTMVSNVNPMDYQIRYEEIDKKFKSNFELIFKYSNPTSQKSFIENFIGYIEN